MDTFHRLLLTLFAASVVAVTAQTAGPALAGDPAALVATKRLLAGEPDSPALHYWVALADWRVVPLLSGRDREAAKRHCEEGLAHCEAILKADAKSAEPLALKAGLQAMAIQFNGASAITLGPEMQANMAHAVGLAPANPRIRLLDGINTLHTPAFFGGGAEKALEKLKIAHELFAAETATDSTAPDWGHDDAYAWAGRCAMELGDFSAARDWFRRALALNPANGWVRTSLLPAAEDSLARKEKEGS